jgi:PAS domain S-box-containing protein/putative nucleotidyltransferase with HDIG domain
MARSQGRGVKIDSFASPALLVSIEPAETATHPSQDWPQSNLELLAATLEYANDVIIITEADTINEPGPKIVYVNNAFERQTGYARAEALGRSPRFLQGPDTDRASLDNVRADLERQQPSRLKVLNYRKNGSQYWSELSIRPLIDASGRCTHLISVQRDVTDQQRDQQELQQLNQRLARRLQRLTALREIDQAIASSVDLNLTLQILLSQLVAQLEVDAASILLLDPDALTLEIKQRTGFRHPLSITQSLRIGEGIAGRAALERRQIEVLDLQAAERELDKLQHLVELEGFRSYIAVPLIAKGEVKGVLGVFNRSPLEHDDEWQEFLALLGSQAAIAIDNLSLFEKLQRSNIDLRLAYDETIEGWSRALDLRDKETEGHTQRVTAVAVRLARALGVSGEALLQLKRGALLHDIGKMGIPDSILLKAGALTPEERAIIERHPDMARELLSSIRFLGPATDIPYAHHERWDGTGYPRRLKGEQIPLAARIFAVVDVWDALRSDRPYRLGWSEERVVEHIRLGSGSHFDPRVVAAFLEMFSPGAAPS